MAGIRLPPWGYPVDEDLDEPPPASVADVIPPFKQYGEHNCGDHQHNFNNKLACSNCHTRVKLGELHDLPCGDLICRDCLLVKAFSVKYSIEKNRDEIHESRKKMVDIDLAFFDHPNMISSERNLLIRRHTLLKRKVIRLAGFTCCGVDMRLDRFLPCLSTMVSRELWLAARWLSDTPNARRVCAWPDCGAYLPVCCGYPVPEECARRWYCVVCQGNSMDCARTLEMAQTRFPFLPRGQPALTPSS
ncbi:hypothetical protein C8A00DRAFT_10993 [Chaetomidium leptoderma]|uniref:Uncharacterized protein n=1 Tax=Chaetomidium leptoderma TaxID=669021 RepID=A0AAN6VVW6_9PEZI|nr:hypothetical protein C8A00DRAFT_10993 [Chaetomidium leptoderma]